MSDLDDEFAALSPQATSAQTGPQSLDSEFAALAPDTGASAPQQPKALGAWSSAAVRPVVKALASLPMLPADAGIAAGNYVNKGLSALGVKTYPELQLGLPSDTVSQALDKYTTAPTGIGKGAEFASTALLGSKLPMPTGVQQAPAGFNAASAPTSALTGAQQQALTAGQQLGMRVTPGTQMGSKALQQVEAKLESQPWTSGPFNALKAGNQGALNRVAAQSIGEDAPQVDASVMGRANDRLGQVFQNIRNPDKIADTTSSQSVLDQIDQKYEGLLPADMAIRDNKLVGQFSKLAADGAKLKAQPSGAANLQQLGQLSSKLGKSAYKQMTTDSGDRDLGQALYDVKNHIDDLVQSGLEPDEAQTYGAARQQYRALMQLTGRVGTVNPSTGNVSGANLANYLQQTDRKGFLFGGNQSPLYQAARFSQAFKPVVGDSGTATRSPNLFDLGGLPLGLPANIASRFYLSRPGAAALRAPGAIARLGKQAVRPAAIGGLLGLESSQ